MENHNNVVVGANQQYYIEYVHTKVTYLQQDSMSSLEPEFHDKIVEINDLTFRLEQLNDLLQNLNSTDILQQHKGCIGIGKILQSNSSPIQTIIDSNCLPRFTEFLKQNNYPVLQGKAAWCLSSIAAYGTNNQIKLIIDNGVLPLLCKLINSPYLDNAERAVWALGNIAIDCNTFRDIILNYNGINSIASLLIKTRDEQIIKSSTWVLSSLCRGNPRPQYELIQDAILPLCQVFMTGSDSEVLIDSSWAIVYLSQGNEQKIQRIIETGIIPTLIRLLNHESDKVQVPCLIIISNICNGVNEQIQQILNHCILPNIFRLIEQGSSFVLIESLQVLNNIAAGNDFQKSQIINSSEQVQSIFSCMKNGIEKQVRELAASVIFNCTTNANPQIIQKLVEYNVLQIFSDILQTSSNIKVLSFILESLKNILECGKNYFIEGNQNPFSLQLETLGALDPIKYLSDEEMEEDDKVFKRSLCILEDYFSEQII